MKELYSVKLSNGMSAYVVADDEGHARDLANDWAKERFIGGSPPSISETKLIGETKSRGRGTKLIL